MQEVISILPVVIKHLNEEQRVAVNLKDALFLKCVCGYEIGGLAGLTTMRNCHAMTSAAEAAFTTVLNAGLKACSTPKLVQTLNAGLRACSTPKFKVLSAVLKTWSISPSSMNRGREGRHTSRRGRTQRQKKRSCHCRSRRTGKSAAPAFCSHIWGRRRVASPAQCSQNDGGIRGRRIQKSA